MYLFPKQAGDHYPTPRKEQDYGRAGKLGAGAGFEPATTGL